MRFVLAIFMAQLLACANVAYAETSPDWNATTLTGDWGGARSKLYKNGVSVEIVHKSDVMGVVSGGIKHGAAWMGNSEVAVDMDLEKLLGWGSTTAHFHVHNQLGSKFNRDYVGSFIGVDNIEHVVNTVQIDRAWVDKSFFEEKLSILAGLYTIDSEFYVTETTGLFFQPPYGPGNELSASGQAGPPIFPTGALGLRLKYTSANKNFYLQGALTDGVPGDPDNLRGTHIKLGDGDGTLGIVELGYTPQKEHHHSDSAKPDGSGDEEADEFFNKTAIGFWHYSSKTDDLTDFDAQGNPKKRNSQGVYIISERTLLTEEGHPSQGLAGFIRFGTANKDNHQADWTGSIGLRYHGLFSGRDDDIAGIAITVNHASEKYRRANAAESTQTSLELTYSAQLKPWLALIPTLQYVHNPNMDPALSNTGILGARAEISF